MYKVLALLVFGLLPLTVAAQDVDPDLVRCPNHLHRKADKVVEGPTALSDPPIWNHQLTFKVETVLRGDVEIWRGAQAYHNARQDAKHRVRHGSTVIVAASKERDGLRVAILEPNTEALLDEVKVASLLPLGWKVKSGQSDFALGPARQGGVAGGHERRERKDHLLRHRASGVHGRWDRVQSGKGSAQEGHQVDQPDGDGEYKITVTNPTDKPLVVPALLSADGKVLWDES